MGNVSIWCAKLQEEEAEQKGKIETVEKRL